MQQSHLLKVKSLREKLKQTPTVKRLNQVIRRKQYTNDRLRRKQRGNDLHRQLVAAKSALALMKRKHRRLQLYHGRKSTATATPTNEVFELRDALKATNANVGHLENKNLMLQEEIESLHASGTPSLEKEGKTFPPQIRMLVYDAIVHHVPTNHVPLLLKKIVKRTGIKMDTVPHRSTVEMMTRELGVICDLQVAEVVMMNSNLTLGFDATTQEGVHINSVHITSKDDCYVISIDQLPGGTAEDYHQHICSSLNRLADIYSTYNTDKSYEVCRRKMIKNISNTMTDRAVVNHATIVRVCEEWGKSMNELNCHLHPLDTIASSTRSTLKSLEMGKGKLFGNDCFAGNIVLQMNKFRFKDGKGDPKGFTTFLDDNALPRGLIPRYRGNRLHVLFHICGIFTEHHDLLVNFLRHGAVSCGGLQAAILSDFGTATAMDEMRVLGLIGKLLAGPWMTKFYTSASNQVSHVHGISIVRTVIETLKITIENPSSVLSTTTDFFGNPLGLTTTLLKLQEEPVDRAMFCNMVKECLTTVVNVLLRQYDRYFKLEITDALIEETESARTHNIDAEEIMGMFSAAKEHAPNATLCYLSSRIRAQKNCVVDYIDTLDTERRDQVVNASISLARKQRQAKRKRMLDIREELSRRIALKREKKKISDRTKVEKQLRSSEMNVERDFSHLEESAQSDLADILAGKVVGRRICHIWYNREMRSKTMYNGKVEKLKKKAGGTYVIGYWSQDEEYDDAMDYDVSIYEMAADFVCDDVTMA